MRLICPNCAAAYEVAEAAVPSDGTHVQCSACHTRWFARRTAPAPEALSEDEIIARLETRSERRRPRAVELSADRSPPPNPVRVLPTGPARPETSEGPALAEAATPASEEAVVQTPLRPRPGPERAPGPQARPAPVRESRFGRGVALGLGLAAAAAGFYLAGPQIARQAPVLAPHVEAYAAQVEAGRDWIEDRFGPLRDAATGR